MVALIDFDSILYTSVYKVVSIRQMREALSIMPKQEAKQWLKEEVYNESINRCENQLLKMQNYLQSIFFQEIKSFELYITTCTKSFRKELSKEYKKKRKSNPYVWMMREHYKFNDAKFSDTHEADDLIAQRVNELGRENCIVVSTDKDLKQIGGWIWSYLKQAEKDMHGSYIKDENGNKIKSWKYNNVTWITQQEANHFFWLQMLMGDYGDGIPGLKEVGIKTAEKILNTSDNFFKTVAREYIKRNQKKDFWINYKLLKLQ